MSHDSVQPCQRALGAASGQVRPCSWGRNDAEGVGDEGENPDHDATRITASQRCAQNTRTPATSPTSPVPASWLSNPLGLLERVRTATPAFPRRPPDGLTDGAEWASGVVEAITTVKDRYY